MKKYSLEEQNKKKQKNNEIEEILERERVKKMNKVARAKNQAKQYAIGDSKQAGRRQRQRRQGQRRRRNKLNK